MRLGSWGAPPPTRSPSPGRCPCFSIWAENARAERPLLGRFRQRSTGWAQDVLGGVTFLAASHHKTGAGPCRVGCSGCTGAGRNAGSRSPARFTGASRGAAARIGTARIGTARIGTARIGTARIGTARIGTARTGVARTGVARTGVDGAGVDGAGVDGAGGRRPGARGGTLVRGVRCDLA